MPTIQTITSPHRNHISIAVPKEYRSYSFQVILVPLSPKTKPVHVNRTCHGRRKSFVDALLSCPKFADGDEVDVARDLFDTGREIDL